LAAAPHHDGSRHEDALREIVTARAANVAVPILIPLDTASRQVQLTWRNAFGQHVLELEDVEFVFLSSGGAALPLGAVGLTSAGLDQAPRLLRDIADHYGHYRRTAESFAPAWGEWHSPEKVVRFLTEDSAAKRRCAA
jgi:hypothetical protein